jgi:glutaconate CoA-transferase subunit B
MKHELRRFVQRVDYITSPGWGVGSGWRKSVGLPRGGPAAVITTLGVFGFDTASREMTPRSLHPGVTPEELQEQTGWPLPSRGLEKVTRAPTKEELAVIRRYDPERFWTGF